jgi:hypothetical protein
MTMELHPLCTLFPRLAGAEFDSLKADIIAHGQREPIVIYDGKVLDGGNRYLACVEAGIEPKTIPFCGGDPISFVLSANFHRRHLSAGQQAAVVAAAQDWSRAFQQGGDRIKVQPLHLDSVADRAKASGASVRTQKMADKVAKASPDLAKQVAHGEISLPKALEQISPRATKPELAPVEPESEHAPDLVSELEAADKELRRLSSLIEQLTGDSDHAKIAAEWSMKFDQLSGRNAQLVRTLNEAQKQARYANDMLAKIRKALGVLANADIIPALMARRMA